MVSNNGLMSKLFSQKMYAPSVAGTAAAVSGQPVNDQLVASFGSVTLSSALQPQNMVEIANYNGLPISSMRIHLSVTDTTSTTVPSGVFSIENALHELKIQTNTGVNIMDLFGDQLDISTTSRYLNPAGLVNNSPTPDDSAASTPYLSEWDIIIPFSIAAKWFPLKLFFTVNTLASRASTLEGMTSVVNNLNLYASYHPIDVIDQSIVTQTMGVSSTGTIALQSNYLLSRVYYMQAYAYGGVESSSATDGVIGSTGDGITFTPNGSLYLQNTPLSSLISKENSKYPNTVSTGIGHETGMINLFTESFVATPSTQFSIGFTSKPTTAGAAYAGASGQMRAIWILNL